MDHQQGPAVQHRGLCSVLRGSLDGGAGVWGRMDTCVCVAGSLAVHLKLSQRCFLIIYLPIQNEEFFKKEKTITSFF